jgi:hypothetical protein
VAPSQDGDFQVRLLYSVRALGLLLAGGVSIGFVVGVAIMPLSLVRYFQENHLEPPLRHILLACILGGGVAAVFAGVLYLFTHFATPSVAARLYHASRRLAPLYLAGFFALLFRCEVWKGRELAFLTLVLLFGVATWAAVTSALRAGPFPWEEKILSRLCRFRKGLARAMPRTSHSLPFILVLVGVIFYVSYFGYYTYCFYYSLRSGYDPASTTACCGTCCTGDRSSRRRRGRGRVAAHFGNHAELLAYVLLPFYAIRQNSGTLMLIQSTVLGAAAIPLYKLARRHIDPWPACILALTYLLYPALHGENLFEFHFLPLRPVLVVVGVVLPRSAPRSLGRPVRPSHPELLRGRLVLGGGAGPLLPAHRAASPRGRAPRRHRLALLPYPQVHFHAPRRRRRELHR